MPVRNIVMGCSDPRRLGSFYAELLGWRIVREDWLLVAKDRESLPRLAFDEESPYRAPRWGDPDRPAQLHVDLAVQDIETAERHALRLGASRLEDHDQRRTYEDPDGHPFCLYRDDEAEGSSGPISHGIGRVVFDCFSPRALAVFYEKLLELRRLEDAPDWVVSGFCDRREPALAFQHSQAIPPRWPDPSFPQQMHLDFDVTEDASVESLALDLGAIRLPDMGGSCPVYADPSAHPFCLCSPNQ
ncbi:MAG TPA: VOC family protein [Chloroflexota bacterium]|nr:VOC family protein [Chloroflexota bacterium]